MTKARVFRSGLDRAGRRTFFIDGKRVKEKHYGESTRKSLEIARHPRTKKGRVRSIPPSLRPAPRPLAVRPRIRPRRRFVARVRVRPEKGRVGDEYAIVTLEVESDHRPDEKEWFALTEAAYPGRVGFFVKDSREV